MIFFKFKTYICFFYWCTKWAVHVTVEALPNLWDQLTEPLGFDRTQVKNHCCRKRLFCGALVISLCHLMVESWVGLNSVLEMNWSSTRVTRKLLPPLSTDLAACPSMESPYCVSAIRYPSNKRTHTHTHCLCDTHSVHIFTDTHNA